MEVNATPRDVIVPLQRAAPPTAESFAALARILTIWHVVGSAASLIGLLLASRGGDDQLPWMPRYALQGFFLLATLVNVAAAYGILTKKQWARSASLVVNYLLAVVGGVATLHQINAFRALGNLGDGLYKAFVPFLFVLLGLIVVLVALQLLADRPTASTLLRLKTVGWIFTAVAGVWFVIKADPTGMLSKLGGSLTQPLTLGSLAVTVCAALACRRASANPSA